MFKASESLTGNEPQAGLFPLRLVAGGLVWASLSVAQPPLAVWILAFGPTVIVPLGLGLIERTTGTGWERNILAFGRGLLLPTATLFVASFWLEQGAPAASLAAAWLVTALVLGCAGVLRLGRNGGRVNAEAALAAALLLLPVGAGWAVLSRAGLRPQGFSDEIVLLTGVHFHYAGFALPILAARAVGARLTVFRQAFLAAVVLGVPLVGMGISLSPLLEVIAAIMLAAACLLLVVLQVKDAIRSGNANRTMLLLVSSTSLAAAMGLAGVYAIGEFTEIRWLGIPAMIQTHGVLNAFGFALCGLLARVADQRHQNIATTGR